MALRVAPKITSRLPWITERTTAYAAGKHMLLDWHLSGATAGILGGASTALLATLGGAAALSAGLTVMDSEHQIKELRELYKDEVAAKLHKSVDAVTNKDLNTLAKGDGERGIEANHTLDEALKKIRRQRNLTIVLSVVASVASFSLLLAAVSGGMFAGMGVIGAALAEGAIGVLGYHAIKEPLHYLGDKVLGLDDKTTHDRITELQKDRDAGRDITREQILSVLVSAQPKLDEIVQRQFGKDYDELSVADKQRAVQTLGTMLNLDTVASRLNSGQVNVTELAFAVEGQASGVGIHHAAQQEAPKGFLGAISDKMHELGDRLSGKAHKAEPIDVSSLSYTPREYNDEHRSTANQIGRSIESSAVSHAARISVRREATVSNETPALP